MFQNVIVHLIHLYVLWFQEEHDWMQEKKEKIVPTRTATADKSKTDCFHSISPTV